MSSSYFQSSEFKRASTNAADSAVKVFFKWLGIGVAAAINFIKDMIKMAVGAK